jgi:transcriptional regulator with XRE-family HTH domain
MTGQQLRQARLELGLTQQQLALILAVTQPRVSDIERGQRKPTIPQQEAVQRLLDERRQPIVADISAALEPLVGPERARQVATAIIAGDVPHTTIERRDHATA